MTEVPIRPISLKTAAFTILDGDGTRDYSTSVGQVVFIPSVTPVPEYGLCSASPDGYGMGPVAWAVSLAYAQDLATPESLMNYILARFGERRTVTFAAEEGGALVTADVLLIPGQIGGVPGQPLSATVTLPIYGKPTFGSVAA